MRIRNVKNKKEIINNSILYIENPESNINNWNKVFNNDNPIHIEIGMGKGNFIIECAKKFKNINFIGIEKEESILARAILKEENLNNLRFIRYDAENIDKIFNKEIDRIYLNFSDPWPKTRHAKRRLTSIQFLKKYDKIFKQNNEIILKTDNKGLFAYSIESLTNYGYLLKNVDLDLKQSDDNIETEYETKFRNKGITINRLEAYKDNNIKTIAVIGAMDEEVKKLIDYYNLTKVDDIFNIYVNNLNNKRIIVSSSGVGKVNSAMVTQHLIDKYKIDLIINTGIAGSISNNIKSKDVVLARNLTYHDFTPCNIMNKYVGLNGVIPQDDDILSSAEKILKEENINFCNVSICSGDSFILDVDKKHEIARITNCEVLDMESCSIAHVCFKNKIKSLIIRIISDDTDSNNYDELEAIEKSYHIITKIVDRF